VRIEVARSARFGGVPVLLVHGYSSSHANWEATGWTGALEEAGRDWIAPDLRGHGGSAKPHAPADYRSAVLVDDLVRTLDGAGAERADVIGYSLGGELAVELAVAHPGRVRRLVAGGIGERRPNSPEAAAEVYEHAAAGTEPPVGPTASMWARASAVPGADPLALAACLAGVSGSPPLRDLDRYGGPALLFAGTADEVATGIESVQHALGAELLRLEGHVHSSALSAPEARDRVLTFLGSGSE
jgi:pimeloyl-ACP methyl ester carboxylesterase